MVNYGFTKTLDHSFEDAREKVVAALKAEGYGVLTEIDVQAKFKEKLGIDFNKYQILGACNPKNAHEAITLEENIGLLLPCNVILYENDKGVHVSFIKPSVAMGMIDNPKLGGVAQLVETQLKKAFDSL